MTPDAGERPVLPPPLHAIADAGVADAVRRGEVGRDCRQPHSVAGVAA